MKKLVSIILSIISVICISFAFVGCGKGGTGDKEDNKFNNNLPSKKASAEIDFQNKKINVYNENEQFDLLGYEFYDRTDLSKINLLRGGDRLEIYYEDDTFSNIDHILVDRACVLELIVSAVPGAPSDYRDVYSEESRVSVNNLRYDVLWVIDNNGNFIDLKELNKCVVYGTYLMEEVNHNELTDLYYLHSLYLYDPRS